MAEKPEAGDREKWASWKDRSDGTADSRRETGEDAPKARSGAPKSRGYQESRRFDRERRTKRTDKKDDDKTAEEQKAESKPAAKTPSKGDSRTDRQADTKGRGGWQVKYEPRSGKADSGREVKTGRRSDSGRKPTEGRDGAKRGGDGRDKRAGERGSGRSGEKGSGRDAETPERKPKNADTGAELLNLLHSKDDKSDGSKSGKRPAKELRGKGKVVNDLEAQWQREEEDRKRREDEERRKREEEEREAAREEERVRMEEDRKRKEEEEAQRLKEEEMKSIQDFIQDSDEKLKWKAQARVINLKASENRPDESFFYKLDSNLKKNTAFVKKLKNMTEGQKDSLTRDLNALNLTKYIGEAAVAITEAKLKMSDIPCALHICSLLHQRYADFPGALMENWNKVLLTKKDDKVPNPSKLRVDLRFFADLVAAGVFTLKEGLPVLATQLTLLISHDKDNHNNLTIILSFVRHCGDDYAGLVSQKYKLLAEKYSSEIPRSTLLPAERQKACRNLLKDYFSSLCKHLERQHNDLRKLEKHNRKILQTKGELSTERKEHYDATFQAFQKLLTNSQSFSDYMNESLPELIEEEIKADTDEMGIDIYHPMKAEYEYSGDQALFEDEDTRQFYEHIPDLKAVIPGILYKDSVQATQAATEEQDTTLEDMNDLDIEALEKALTLEMEGVAETEVPDRPAAGGVAETEGGAEGAELEVALDGEDDDCDIASSMKLVLEAFLNSLPNCVNRELIDRAATDFCMNLNTKANRKKLVRGLFTVQRTRYDLLPFYARLVATLHPCMPDVATDLATLLKGDFRWHVRKKDQINIESKLKTVRFIGELVKFLMFPKTEALHCMKMLMFDFQHHNIEMACALLETCGRFLYRSPDSHHRTKVYLEVMMRKKAAFHFDQRYDTMMENAYYYSNPPETKQEARKVRPPAHEYIRRLLYKDLSKITTEKVLRQLRKLHLDDSEIRLYLTKCLKGIWNVRYNSVHCCANLLAGLASYHEDIAIDVVDGVLEDIRIGMEINHPKYNQRRVSCIKFLGELYNYRMVESGVIFKTLYSFITFGVSLDEAVPSPLDPPEHLFRIRMTCVLLDTCGQYFDRGSSKKKLDYFLAYFLRYYLYKRSSSTWHHDHPFPIDIEYTLRDTFDVIRPKMRIPVDYETAGATVREIEADLMAKIADVLPQFKMTDDGTESEADGLSTIQEEGDESSQGLSQVGMTTDDTQGSDGENDDQTGSHDDHTGSQSQSQSRQIRHGDDAGEEGAVAEGDGDESEDLLESAGEEEADDQLTVLTGGPRRIDCPEDDDFMNAFDKMLTDTFQARNQEALKGVQVEITLPVHIKPQHKPKPPVVNFLTPERDEEDEDEDEDEEEEIVTGDQMKFTLMTRRGNKPQYATLNIPVSENFASKFKEREQACRAEKERMKRVVLDFHERQEEEDYQEMIASMSRPAMVTLNREKKVRYQHPKGAPDADLIFGSKKR